MFFDSAPFLSLKSFALPCSAFRFFCLSLALYDFITERTLARCDPEWAWFHMIHDRAISCTNADEDKLQQHK